MAKKPEIPKRLAARIRGAQEKVRQARLAIKADEFNGRQISSRLDEYDSDPHGFASRHYGRNGFDSYPVQTNISHNRERIGYIESRREQRITDLAEAEANLERVEAEVLAEVRSMRPTSGRVPWPRRLPSFANYKEEVTRELAQLREEHIRYLEDVQAQYEREVAEIEADAERDRAAFALERQIALSRMTPEERARDTAATKAITDGLKSGKFTVMDIIDHLKAQQKAG
ncbi:hypothetical protein ACKU27_18440 [Sphingobium yanoikuyae]|jgi:hypothetical protein|uniref:hypothetical protein n=1 Tax=Sphingobium yanoikuyae TaxID=13690 RepID=UPI003B909619